MMTGEWLGSVFQEYCLEGDKTGEMWGEDGGRERERTTEGVKGTLHRSILTL